MSYGSHPHHPGDRYQRAPGGRFDRDPPHPARHHPQGHSEQPGRRKPPTDPPAAERRTNRGAYTFGHGRRQVRLGPVAFWTIVGTLVIMAGWSIVTATYFAFRDDVLARLLARQAEMQIAYEDRIADMRAQVDRVTSRQLLDQEQFEQKLDQLVRRQAALESRAMTLGTLADPATTGSIKGGKDAAAPAKPTPITESGAAIAPPGRGARLEPRGLPAAIARLTRRNRDDGVAGTLMRLQQSLDRVEAQQSAALNAIESKYDGRVRQIRGVLGDLGLDPGKVPPDSAVGGPFVPLRLPSNASAFDRQLQRIHIARAQADRLNRKLVAVPIRKPVPGELDLSSAFGVRLDPFFGRPAMHTGLDFRGDIGEPVHATAAGTVTQAGWSGGYGKMVEVDHGNGLATRYGHLSEIDVSVGQAIKIGQVLGRLGSTGRSTGPHLHYETRVDGDAVDPQKFLRAGVKLGVGS